MSGPPNWPRPVAPTSDATRIARYLHLVVELPKAVVDAGNAHACSKLASFKRDYLIDALAAFRKPLDSQLSPSRNQLFARLLRRALRRRHRHRGFPSGDPRDRVNGMVIVLLAGVGPLLIYHFMSCPEVRTHMEEHADVWREERRWLDDLGDRPVPLGRSGSPDDSGSLV